MEEFTFGSNEWHERYAVITNIGIFVFEKGNIKAKPEFVPWVAFQMEKKNYKEV